MIDWQAVFASSPALFVALVCLVIIIRWTEGQNKREKERDDADAEDVKRRDELWTKLIQRIDVQSTNERDFSERQIRFLESRITTLEKMVTTLETGVSERDKRLSDQDRKITTLTKDLQEALQTVGAVSRENENLKQQLITMAADRAQVAEDRDRMRRELDSTKSELTKVRNRLKRVEDRQKGDTDQLNPAKVADCDDDEDDKPEETKVAA